MNHAKKLELAEKGIHINDTTFSLYSHLNNLDETSIFELSLYPSNFSSQCINRFENFNSQFYPVGTQGLSDIQNGEIGSYRKTVYDESLADLLTLMILPQLPKFVTTTNLSPVDTGTEEDTIWHLDCVSPLFRYMRYKDGGEHFAHYDAPYVTDNETRTLFSGVLYLTTNEVFTRFILDNQFNIPFSQRDTKDWTIPLEESDKHMYAAKKSVENTCIIFPHGVCHDVSKNIEGKDRIIIRFDIQCIKVYKNEN